MNKEQFEKKKNTIYGLLCDDLYVPMRTKEIAMLLDIPKTRREELQEVLDALIAADRAEKLREAAGMNEMEE